MISTAVVNYACYTNCCHKHWSLTLSKIILHLFTLFIAIIIVLIQFLLVHEIDHYYLAM